MNSAEQLEVVKDVARVDGGALQAWIRLVRPTQWIKNVFIVAPLLFSGHALERTAQFRALTTFVAFSLLASGVYCFNDVLDRASDKAHPLKRYRPVAAGLISPAAALLAAALLSVSGVVIAFVLSPVVGAMLLAYALLNAFYGVVLKRMVIVDVFTIAAFFILRLLAGSAAVQVVPSIWLLLCGGLLALFLGFAKRRHELVSLGDGRADHRAVLAQYSTPFLDSTSVVLLAVTIISYIMYTVESAPARSLGGSALSYSTVFVLFGVLRYLFLIYQEKGGSPTETLLADRQLLATVGMWGAYCAWVLYR
jgi:4-hydroxybenzoate polyprenyltransferase